MKIKKRYFFFGLILCIFGLIFFPLFVRLGEDKKMYTVDAYIPPAEVALVFGAAVNKDGNPSDALEDRLITAAALYNSGTVEKILVSGDNITDEYYNEPKAMKNFLLSLGIPEEVIKEDFAGARTYDSCIRAKEIWGIEKAILVTQEFHLPRALFTCNALDVESIGVIADRQAYVMEDYYQFREWFALYKTFIDVYLWKPDYIGGKMEQL